MAAANGRMDVITGFQCDDVMKNQCGNVLMN